MLVCHWMVAGLNPQSPADAPMYTRAENCVCVCVFVSTTAFLLFQPTVTDHMRAANDLMQAGIGARVFLWIKCNVPLCMWCVDVCVRSRCMISLWKQDTHTHTPTHPCDRSSHVHCNVSPGLTHFNGNTNTHTLSSAYWERGRAGDHSSVFRCCGLSVIFRWLTSSLHSMTETHTSATCWLCSWCVGSCQACVCVCVSWEFLEDVFYHTG